MIFFLFKIISFQGQDPLYRHQRVCKEVRMSACKWECFLERQCKWSHLGEYAGPVFAVSAAGWWSHSLQLHSWIQGCCWSFWTPKKWHLCVTSNSNASTATGRLPTHVLKAHRNQVCLQVREHHSLLPDLCGRHHRQLNAAQNHLQEQVHEEWTQCPDRQPGSGRPALYYHCHPNQCV